MLRYQELRTKTFFEIVNYEKGMTLIEVVVAMVIFATGFLAIAGLVVATTRNNTAGNTLTEATMLTQAKIEYLKALPLEKLVDACPHDMVAEKINQIYTQHCEVNPLGSSNTIKTVTVITRWKKSGHKRQIVLQTNTRGRGR